MDKITLLDELVEVSAKPVLQARNYWHASVYNVLKAKKDSINDDNNYFLELKADILSIKRLWREELDTLHSWGKKQDMPSTSEISETISNMEKKCETEVLNGKVVFKNGDEPDKDDLQFLERYSSIKNINERLTCMEEDYLYCRIRDYIVLNIYQFLSENREFAINILKDDTDEVIIRMSDLISKYADRGMYADMEED
ncbi:MULTISPECIES: hypothetical protein [Clostridium]|uniref:Uncharacterized protein n=3 Tax=Clostridium TaxID=1485 RepID=D8GRA9_CLOLD|nr:MULTISPECIES: hypothetical protein [Clostridium]ADK14247.1 hypothetical protein CLJU_c11790 [Clostridium ljungdahlii DSM 13528]AGY77473.1 hypothetical protein CAETHG_3270 [Clostridium autoethanogenum DSM 10061]ALU37614.1 hypothetical protein CLAU_3187 [Clostridium autoethanogenum DSM 10061]OAA86076.1 hypothetical protein WX45_04099 [Clostridium ljungdahlii DSM 13528]OVY49261.1 hypothetical protein WX72_04033 [Clostridium autoethanogenum]